MWASQRTASYVTERHRRPWSGVRYPPERSGLPRCSSAQVRRSGRSARRGRPDLPMSAHGRNASTSISTQAGPASLPTTASAGLWSANRPRPGCVDGRPVLVPVTGGRDRDLRDLPWAGACGGERAAEIGERLPGQAARPVLIPGWRSPRAPCRFPSRWPGPILACSGRDVPRASPPGGQPPAVP
jgi:hypothetical protein